MHYSENLSIKYHDQGFAIKTAFSGKHWIEQTIDELGKFLVFGEFNKNIDFSTKFQYWMSWKTNNLRFASSSLQYILLKMTINQPASKMKN